MKVNIDRTLVIDDEDLIKMADVIDGKQSRRTAKRAEVKDYLWEHGSHWKEILDRRHREEFGGPEPETDDDLIGGDADDGDLEDLI